MLLSLAPTILRLPIRGIFRRNTMLQFPLTMPYAICRVTLAILSAIRVLVRLIF